MDNHDKELLLKALIDKGVANGKINSSEIDAVIVEADVDMEKMEFQIDAVLKKEKMKNEKKLAEYEDKLQGYPRGTLVFRESNGRQYCYFRYRDGKKIITKYAGTVQLYDELSAVVAQRDKLIMEIKHLKAENARIDKMAAVK